MAIEDELPLDEMLEDDSDSAAEKTETDTLGEAFGLLYAPNEELRCGEKEQDRDRHRWELDPASAEDYIERAHPHSLSWHWRHFTH